MRTNERIFKQVVDEPEADPDDVELDEGIKKMTRYMRRKPPSNSETKILERIKYMQIIARNVGPIECSVTYADRVREYYQQRVSAGTMRLYLFALEDYLNANSPDVLRNHTGKPVVIGKHRLPRVTPYTPDKWHTVEKVIRILRAAKNMARDRAIIATPYYGMARASECGGLHVEDYDPKTRVLYINATKMPEKRGIPMPLDYARIMAPYLKIREELKIDTPYLFVNMRNGGKLDRIGIHRIVAYYGELAGLDSWPH